MKIVSWNINGIRSNVYNYNESKKIKPGNSLKNLINNEKADIICIQETRISVENSKILNIPGYYSYFNESKLENARSGNRYSGTCIYSNIKPLKVEYSIPDYEDNEGRIIILYLENDLIIINVYTPNSGTNLENRVLWQNAFIKFFVENKNKNIIFCGDMNVAYREEDIHFNYNKSSTYKKKTKNIVGYLPVERKFINDLININFRDCYLEINNDKYDNPCDFKGFTWWDPRSKKVESSNVGIMRQKNIGWRIDYFFINYNVNIINCKVLKYIGEDSNPPGSDHAPIILEI